MQVTIAQAEPMAPALVLTDPSGPRRASENAAPNYWAALAGLRAEYEVDARAGIEKLRGWLDHLTQEPSNAAALTEVLRSFHSYAGSGATFGLPGISAIGNRGEALCSALQKAGAPPSAADLAQLRQLREALGQELASGAVSEQRETDASDVGAAKAFHQAPTGRILMVEDDPFQARFVCMTLENAGYELTVCDDPSRFQAELAAGRPDLVLMDVMLPGASGYELVRWLRHDSASAKLPVLFLTAEGQMQARLESSWAGGDDHLVKPLSPTALLAAVADRLERSRRAALMVERDPITHALTEAELVRRAEAVVSEQSGNPHRHISWVAVELDPLRSIQERYGEPTGNRVLAAAVRLLRLELGQGTTIGRCNGPKFAVLIDGMRPHQALQAVNGLRQKFAAHGHRTADGGQFSTTFCAGIAALAPGMTCEQWREEAERGLRVARSSGRNRVELAR
jgi:diguanylate cyclase (GGDEF)-like protein